MLVVLRTGRPIAPFSMDPRVRLIVAGRSTSRYTPARALEIVSPAAETDRSSPPGPRKTPWTG